MALEKKIDRLEQQFQQLISVLEQLSSENKALRQHCAQLQHKNEQASQHVESAISRLKSQAENMPTPEPTEGSDRQE